MHLAIVAALFLSSAVRDRLFRRRPPETISFVSLDHIVFDEPQAAPAPEPVSPPPPPPPPPPVVPEQPRPRPSIERSRERVRRDPPPQPAPQITRDEIRERLARDVPTTRVTSGPTADAWDRTVFQTFYDAWNQPGAVSAGTLATVRIRVERDGRITQRSLERPSGNAIMDASVMRAVNSVSHLPPLPDRLRGPHYDLTIDFELIGGR